MLERFDAHLSHKQNYLLFAEFYCQHELYPCGGITVHKEVLLSMADITKVFPGVKALDEVSRGEPGEVHAIVGKTGREVYPGEHRVRCAST